MDTIERTYYLATRAGEPIGTSYWSGYPDLSADPGTQFDTVVEAGQWAREHQERFPSNSWPGKYGVRRVTAVEVTRVDWNVETEDL